MSRRGLIWPVVRERLVPAGRNLGLPSRERPLLVARELGEALGDWFEIV
jgi:hypothetical protein